ncbi:L-threonine dehydrogenase [Vibrio chagasii]|nr:L-threonine dehydrogenase [Vibrio chagasii]
MAATFFLPTVNIIGKNALVESIEKIKSMGFKKVLIVTDKPIVSLGFASKVSDALATQGIETVVFDGVQPNPTVGNVEEGLSLLQSEGCDSVISLGGGSPHDCAKGIALVATNSGSIKDYEGVDQSALPQLPLIAINTTAGTASEITRFCIITDEERHVKMAIVDKHTTPLISVNDPYLMKAMPVSLTAATGMDALTHAIEALVSTAATPITDACAEKAIALVHEHLSDACENGDNMVAREGMAYAQLAAGMAFNSASLGHVHAMAHQLGGLLNLPHGVCNAVLLPHVEAFNLPSCPDKLALVAKLLGVDVSGLSDEEAGLAGLEAIKTLSKKIGIPSGLKELGVKEEHFDLLAENARKDACSFTNPREASHEDVVGIFRAAM